MADASSTRLDEMEFMGVTTGGVDYERNAASGQLTPTQQPKWRKINNGNPPDMLSVARELMGAPVLFIVERDTNRNVVLYMQEQGRGQGREETQTPVVDAVWLMIQHATVHYDSNVALPDDAEIELGDVHTEALTTLEAALGYGVRVENGGTRLYVQALKNQPIELVRVGDQWVATIQVVPGTQPLVLRRIMIHTEPRPFAPWPQVVEVHLEVQQLVDQQLLGGSVWYRYAVRP